MLIKSVVRDRLEYVFERWGNGEWRAVGFGFDEPGPEMTYPLTVLSRPDRPVGVSEEAAFDTFVRSFNGDEAGDIDDVSALDGSTGWAMHGGNDVRAVFEKARAVLTRPPAVVDAGQVERVTSWMFAEAGELHERAEACEEANGPGSDGGYSDRLGTLADDIEDVAQTLRENAALGLTVKGETK